MNDFETRLDKLLNEDVDARVGARRPAPPHGFDRTSTARSSGPRVRWLPPLLAAACVAVIVGGGVAGTRLLSSDRTPPGRQSVVPTPTGPTPTPERGSHTVQLGAASVNLPAGWVARDYLHYLPKGSTVSYRSWCLTPASEPVSTGQSSCPVQFAVPVARGIALDVDVMSGTVRNPSRCPEPDPAGSLVSGDRTLGGRAAEWRQGRTVCADGKVERYEQYVVPTGPAYILYTDQLDAKIHDAMTKIARYSTLPARTDPLRWMDRGYVRSVNRSGGSVDITLDRVIQGKEGVVDNDDKTYRYTVPDAVWTAAPTEPQVGSLIYLRTDGRKVVTVYVS